MYISGSCPIEVARRSKVNDPVDGARHEKLSSPAVPPPQLPRLALATPTVVPEATEGPVRAPRSAVGHGGAHGGVPAQSGSEQSKSPSQSSSIMSVQALSRTAHGRHARSNRQSGSSQLKSPSQSSSRMSAQKL